MSKYLRISIVLSITSLLILSACKNAGDARKRPPNVKDRVQKNIEEGRGFTLMGSAKKNIGEFDFASSNELWRASLDTLDFMPLASANYSGGIIITDWYSDQTSSNESLKISIRFLTNEIRSDALDVKIFKKDCNANNECEMYEEKGDLIFEIKKSILKKAAIYEKENKKSGKSYRGTSFEGQGTDGPNIF